MDKGRRRLDRDLTEKLKMYVQHIKERIDANFTPFDTLLDEEKVAITALENKQLDIQSRLTEIGKGLDGLV